MAAAAAVSQMPLLRVPLKETDEVSWLPLRDYIRDVYQSDPEDYLDEMRALQRMRQVRMHAHRLWCGKVCKLTLGALLAGCARHRR